MIYCIVAGVLVTSWLVGTIIYGFATGRMWIDLNLQGRPILGIWIL